MATENCFSRVLLFVLLYVVVFSARTEGQPIKKDTYKDIRFTDLFKRGEGWIAGDGGYSIPLRDGKTLWTFGDSYIDCYDSVTKTVPCLFQARSAVIITDISDPGVQVSLKSKTGDPTYFKIGTDRKYWFWPLSGFTQKDTTYIFLSRFRSTGEPGMWGFVAVDSNYIAKINVPDTYETRYSVLPSKDSITFGMSVIQEGRYTLVYGIKSNGFGNDLFVAKFPSKNIYAQWQYSDGKNWTTELSRIRKIHSEFTSSFYVCRIENKYLLITTEFSVGCDQGRKIFIARSDNPFGPFVNKQAIWQVDDTLEGHFPFFYIANAHPEFDNGKKELLITYCINGYGSCVETCKNNRLDPEVYRPRAIRVPYSVIFAEPKKN